MSCVPSTTSPPVLPHSLSSTSSITQLTISSSSSPTHNPLGTLPNRYRLCRLNPSQIQDLMNQFETNARQAYLQGSPRADQLLTLMQFNVFRALISNTNTIGLSFSWMEDENAISPLSSPTPNINPSTPSSLLPTLCKAQSNIIHGSMSSRSQR